MYQFQSASRTCARTGRPLQPGDSFYSVLYDRQGQWLREDISKDAWQGPPPEAFSFWLTHLPPDSGRKKIEYDDESLLNCFQRFQAPVDRQQAAFRYVLALLLMRRKRLRFEEVIKEGDKEWLVVRDPQTKQMLKILDPRLDQEQMSAVQEELENLLGIAA